MDENEQPRQEELAKEEEPQKDEEESPKVEEEPPKEEEEEEKERECIPKIPRIYRHHNRRRYHEIYERRYSKYSMKRPHFEVNYKRPYRQPKFHRKNKFNNEARYRRGGRNNRKRREERKTN